MLWARHHPSKTQMAMMKVIHSVRAAATLSGSDVKAVLHAQGSLELIDRRSR